MPMHLPAAAALRHRTGLERRLPGALILSVGEAGIARMSRADSAA